MGKVYTVGHSNRTLEEFLDILKYLGVEVLYDVRSFPKSRFVPHFSKEHLSRAVEEAGLSYIWDGRLGGFRRFGRDVRDVGIAGCFRSEGFRAYATYLTLNPVGREAADELALLSGRKATAIMCRERIPWRCHRKIISDYLIARGFTVLHVIEKERVVQHRLSKCARIVEGELRYV